MKTYLWSRIRHVVGKGLAATPLLRARRATGIAQRARMPGVVAGRSPSSTVGVIKIRDGSPDIQKATEKATVWHMVVRRAVATGHGVLARVVAVRGGRHGGGRGQRGFGRVLHVGERAGIVVPSGIGRDAYGMPRVELGVGQMTLPHCEGREGLAGPRTLEKTRAGDILGRVEYRGEHRPAGGREGD
ncbi:hypothetical protein BP6252_09167 [Coleophoma cylindrospora]|uniref:Uncharacterized protein n=1 Tax=Coleophoma cylindrospora TaxID=1849047 RepID=A0A3D8R1H9_9HELO|nr:hypothetical protein BP6252_09167 [Coleophoma cylindrospora]